MHIVLSDENFEKTILLPFKFNDRLRNKFEETTSASLMYVAKLSLALPFKESVDFM